MKIGLICPSNKLYMPYLKNYEDILKENNINYTIINWDRFQIEKNYKGLVYRDKKVGHQRNYLDYYKYKNFIMKILKERQYNKLIIFGLQLTYFLKEYLQKQFNGQYIIDIRDYHKIIKFFNVENIIDKSYFTVISSPGYKIWLPNSSKYIINHNTTIDNVKNLYEANYFNLNKAINISYIGALSNLKVNIELIKHLKNSDKFELTFHGEGIINEKLYKFKEKNNIGNLHIYGRYQKEDEEKLYESAQIINMLLYNDHINNRTCLANRLYNSVLYGKPLLALDGSFMAEKIKKYNLGIVLDSFNGIENRIIKYVKEFDIRKFNEGRNLFFTKVIDENVLFKEKLKGFIDASIHGRV